MKHKPSTTAKWNNGFKKIHNLKVERIDDSILFSKLSDIYSHFEILFDIYNNDKLTDKEKIISRVLKLEKATKEKYKKKEDKIKLKEWKVNKDRKKIGYLKHRAKIDLQAQRKLKERFGENFTKEFGKDSLLGANKVILDTSKQ
tara:strand:+ start:40 stop:471 length:432 start_codon:yes stop_codon:yes gene_type:complete